MATQSNSRPSWKFNALLFVSHIHNAAQHSTKQIKLARYFRSFNGFLFFSGRQYIWCMFSHFGLFKYDKNSFLAYPHWRHCVFYFVPVFFSRVVVHKFHSHISCYEQFGSSFFSLVLVFRYFTVVFLLFRNLRAKKEITNIKCTKLHDRICLFSFQLQIYIVDRKTEWMNERMKKKPQIVVYFKMEQTQSQIENLTKMFCMNKRIHNITKSFKMKNP